MTYTRNAVYTYVRNAIKTAYPDAYCTAKYVPKPSSFPACYIHEIDNNRPIENIQLDYEDVQWESVFEVQVASVKADSALSEAFDIMAVVKTAFNSLHYREFSETNIDRGDRFTVVGRFRRIIGGGDVMPTTPYISA